jgi:hypothetical protein
MFTEDQVNGSINSVDRQLLYDIREELRKLNATLASKPTVQYQEAVEKPQEGRKVRGVKREGQ